MMNGGSFSINSSQYNSLSPLRVSGDCARFDYKPPQEREGAQAR